MERRWRWALAGLCGAWLALAWVLRGYYPIGSFHDDCNYILMARQILSGQAPDRPGYLPGWPLMAAVWLALTGNSLVAVRALNALSLLGAGLLLQKLALPRLGAAGSLGVMTVFLFNPATLTLSSTWLSEPFFLLVMFLCLWMASSPRADRTFVLVGALLGWLAVVRVAGVAVALAVVLGLALSRGRR
ncbi:MAG: hypothetical protein AB1758_11595, partial [Candidatus Eremiobacterota bacterium]